MRRPGWPVAATLLAAAMLLGACGDALSQAEDDWCSTHPAEVQRAVPSDKQRDVEYRDATWKDACRRAYATR
jgi:hypothetical protein